MEAIKRQVQGESHDELCREQVVSVNAETVEIEGGAVEEEINDAKDSIGDTEGDINGGHQVIVEHLKKIMVKGRTGDGIMFKRVDKKVLKVQTNRVNEAVKYLGRYKEAKTRSPTVREN